MGKINLFQHLVRQWEGLHPYNGAQAIKVRRPLDLEASRQAWHDALQVLGLGALTLQGNSYTYRCLNGDAIHYTVQPCPRGTTLEQWIGQELNRAFTDLDACPFRPFAIEEEDGCWFGLIYRHWVADSISVRKVMREWFVRMFDPASATTQPLRLSERGYLSLFGPTRTGWQTGNVLLSTLRWQSQHNLVRRVEDKKSFRDLRVDFKLLPPISGLISPLHKQAHALGATVNDLFLAAIAEACDHYVPTKHRGRRHNLSVGTIVDLRNKAEEPLDDVFDLLLGFTSVCCTPYELADFDRLLASIVAQTRRQKSQGAAEASWLRLLGGLVAGKTLSSKNILNFYRKRVAMAGALSNVNLNRCFASGYHPDPIVQMVRAAPTGPMAPVVFTTTTIGQDLSVGLTYRPAIVTEDKANELLFAFANILQRFVSSATDFSPSQIQDSPPAMEYHR